MKEKEFAEKEIHHWSTVKRVVRINAGYIRTKAEKNEEQVDWIVFFFFLRNITANQVKDENEPPI
jgi:hypothetical protein